MTQLGLNGQDVFESANQLFSQGLDWVTFFREVLGVDGIVRKCYADPQALAQFEQSEEYKKIQQMLAKLRERSGMAPMGPAEPTRVITVRLPKSLHESLRVEAHEKRTSMNKLCISKLLQIVSEDLIPVGAED